MSHWAFPWERVAGLGRWLLVGLLFYVGAVLVVSHLKMDWNPLQALKTSQCVSPNFFIGGADVGKAVHIVDGCRDVVFFRHARASSNINCSNSNCLFAVVSWALPAAKRLCHCCQSLVFAGNPPSAVIFWCHD